MAEQQKSEVARLRQQIEDETYAMNLALNGPACVARHLIIAHRHRSIDEQRAQLATLVGPDEATEITMTIYLNVMEMSNHQQGCGASTV